MYENFDWASSHCLEISVKPMVYALKQPDNHTIFDDLS